jgi:DHA2 family multidrug resistance protein
MFMMVGYNLEISFWHAVWPRLVMGIGLAFLFVPLTTVTFAFMRPQQIGMGTGIFNLVRNLGGSIGIAAITTLLSRRTQFHYGRLAENISLYDARVQGALQKATAGLTAAGQSSLSAQNLVLGRTYATVLRQAWAMSFIDCFWLMGVAILVLFPTIFLMRKPPKEARPRSAGS